MDHQTVRRKAEGLANRLSVADEVPDKELRELLQELRIHQIELELQNEELRRTQESLVAARQEYFDLYNNAPVAYLTLNAQGMITQINLSATQLLGRERRFLVNRPLMLHIQPAYHTAFFNYLDDLVEAGTSLKTELVLVQHGRYVAVDGVAINLVGSENRCSETAHSETSRKEPQYRLVMTDITELRHVERALQLEKEQLAVILRSITDGIIVTDEHRLITLVNPAAAAILQTMPGSLIGRPLRDVFCLVAEESQVDLTAALYSWSPSLEEQHPSSALPQAALLQIKNGHQCFIQFQLSPMRDRGQMLGMIITFRDVTENRKREAEQLRIQKLETIGVMAGGIAHDFNNLLASFFSNVDLAKLHLPSEHKAQRFLDTAVNSLDNAKRLTRQLLTFAQGGEPLKEPLDLQQWLLDAAQFSLHGNNLVLECTIAPDLYQIEADSGQLHQVISNILINAQQSMTHGGKILLNAENHYIEHNRYVRVTVKDEGSGIASHHLNKIFDPYFTTKQSGSGLGLTTSYSIIQKHNGTISVESQLHHGTTVTILLPALSDEKHVNMVSVNSSPSHARSTAVRPVQILVLDDDGVIRDSLREMLTWMGHSVTLAASGEEAIAHYRTAYEDGRPYALVIVDLTIVGGMGGKEATTGILALDPSAKIIVSSGYATDPIMASYQAYGFTARVAKPYRYAELEAVLQQTLSSG